MSIFRPPQTKPRQFNYIPRHYDPVKEERDRRRRELHGTSSDLDNEPYAPGRYIRTQREARDAAREEHADEGIRKVRNLVIITAGVVIAAALIFPRFMAFVERANEEKIASGELDEVVVMPGDSINWQGVTLHERHGDIDFREFESLTPEIINEIEEFQSSIGEITIYDDDVKIVDGKRVEE